MATFTNRAVLSYNEGSADSNVVTGEITEALTATKVAVGESYRTGDTVTYLVHLFNSGAAPLTGLAVADDLGAYTFGSGTVTPLTYEAGSIRYFINGAIQPSPTVVASPFSVSGITVPAGGNALLAYEVQVNGYAPLGEGAQIDNTVTVSGEATATATETVTAATGTSLAIVKDLSPSTVVAGDLITYTFTVENYGSTAAATTDNLSISDTFLPILQNLSVSFNGTAWTAGTEYTYDGTTGAFATVPGQITVPAATFSQDATTGLWTVTPGTSVLTVSGTV